ncbi:MAG: pantetheine-phosphate adenylyltransferase [Sporolactobacillus sp.]|jgi:pantetheine-phosphate adenylyltransferase|nr:pantetheine-phosphate adenylyltransferase [Sporolactobacillus sp.]MCI1880841.1 pantetheine-phosphate adenylyltransferase [Sporolactobacillus sp.]
MFKTAVYPGDFDPVTKGHLDIIKRGSCIFDCLIVAVQNHSAQHPLFSVSERMRLLYKATKGINNIRIDHFNGLLIEYLNHNHYSIVLKGLRTILDFDNEMAFYLQNKRLNPKVETCFLMAKREYSFVSSNIVKEIAMHEGNLASLVPQASEEALQKKFTAKVLS